MRFHVVAKMRRRHFHFSPTFSFVAVCNGGDSAYGGRRLRQIAGLTQFGFVGNRTNFVVDASIISLRGA
jgi:hypothetical protein